MHKYIVAMKMALKDEMVKDLVCISKRYKSELVEIVSKISENNYLSEWRYGLWAPVYIYRIHKDSLGLKLKEAFDADSRGGNPKLTGIYSKKELIKIIEDY